MKKTNSTTLFLENVAQAAIFAFEISGQLSDGHWENARPYNHWDWICNLRFNINENNELGYKGPQHKNYMVYKFLNMLVSGKEGYEWGIRVYQAAKLATVYPDMENNLENSYIGYIAEGLPETKEMEFEEFVAKTVKKSPWRSEYFEKAKFTREIYDAYYASDYSIRDFKNDARALDIAIREQLS